MSEIKCTVCGEEATTTKEFITGKCRFCGGKLEDENGDNSTASEMGMDRDI